MVTLNKPSLLETPSVLDAALETLLLEVATDEDELGTVELVPLPQADKFRIMAQAITKAKILLTKIPPYVPPVCPTAFSFARNSTKIKR